MNKNPALQRAVDIMGGQKSLAEAIGVKQQHVWNWLNRDKRIPLERAIAIENATAGQVTAADLRPDQAVLLQRREASSARTVA